MLRKKIRWKTNLHRYTVSGPVESYLVLDTRHGRSFEKIRNNFPSLSQSYIVVGNGGVKEGHRTSVLRTSRTSVKHCTPGLVVFFLILRIS